MLAGKWIAKASNMCGAIKLVPAYVMCLTHWAYYFGLAKSDWTGGLPKGLQGWSYNLAV